MIDPAPAYPPGVDVPALFHCARMLMRIDAALELLSCDQRAIAVAMIARMPMEAFAVWLVDLVALPVDAIARHISEVIASASAPEDAR